jgi:hypothetical protein
MLFGSTRTILILLLSASALRAVFAQGDLDAFMQQVLARRDDNWKLQQQYVLDERETIEIRGPSHTALWGERRDFTWYIRDGFFVRSPVAFNGVRIGDEDRRAYEEQYLRRERERDARAREKGRSDSGPAPSDAPRDLQGLIRQTEQPGFISSAYFLKFKFDAGQYALVGRERLENRDVLRIEYYPTKLFSDDKSRDGDAGKQPRDGRDAAREDDDTRRTRMMNKASKVTLWVEPVSHQILKYTFDDLDWDFFPGAWLVRVGDVTATMTVGEMFPGVWLPRAMQVHVRMDFAAGPMDLEYSLDYHDYRRADVATHYGVSGRK